MADGNFERFPIPYKYTDDPNSKVPLTSKVNGQSLQRSITLTSTDFEETITGEKMLAALTYRLRYTW